MKSFIQWEKALLAVPVVIVAGIFASLSTRAVPAAAVQPAFLYAFDNPGVLEEADSAEHTSSPYFWLNSGGEFVTGNGVGETMQGSALPKDPWYALYAATNPVDTDTGAHPQNIFRLVTRSSWENFSEEAGFYIAHDNFSASPNRNASNGLLLMSRYRDDGQTLYYAGIRVDGQAVIKKKINGVYYTMAEKTLFPGTYAAEKDDKNLIPHGEWIFLRSETRTNADGSVEVSLWRKLPDREWQILLQTTDAGQFGDTPPIQGPGFAGIRTDFMDVYFQQYQISAL